MNYSNIHMQCRKGKLGVKQSVMFEDKLLQRLKQLFCKHNYFAVASCDNFQEPTEHNKREEAIFYRCEKCLNLKVVRD